MWCGRETQERYAECYREKNVVQADRRSQSPTGGPVLEAERRTVKCVKGVSGVAVPTV